MRFTKVHGAGNDFILIDARKEQEHDYNTLAKRLCHRQTGIGADGLLILNSSKDADLDMRIINNDGSDAEMCGNGIRCFAKYAYVMGIVAKLEFTVQTGAGILVPKIMLDEGGIVSGVRVNMGKPGFLSCEVPVVGEGLCLNRPIEALGEVFTFSSVRVGNPVTAVEVDDPKTFDVRKYGPAIEKHPYFPERTNVAFFKVLDRENVEMRIWERGAGPTLACGTGACGTAVLCAKNGLTERKVNIHLELATLEIEWADDDTVYMTGPAELVFDGDIY
ncbi:diaminopimelate epimerase [Christensenellaceae bacterium OttesenSCG-928-M15]|nr:diaminopimelate epimerase [Christensenellaceae bacterium OttesenSCG-928-M15]